MYLKKRAKKLKILIYLFLSSVTLFIHVYNMHWVNCLIFIFMYFISRVYSINFSYLTLCSWKMHSKCILFIPLYMIWFLIKVNIYMIHVHCTYYFLLTSTEFRVTAHTMTVFGGSINHIKQYKEKHFAGIYTALHWLLLTFNFI